MIDGSIRMVIPPVEPEVLDGRQSREACPRRGTAYRTTLKVPLARRAGVHQDRIRSSALAEKLYILVLQPTQERAHRFSIRAAQNQDRISSHPVLNRTLLENRVHWISFALPQPIDSDNH